ncbi:MAG TPA: tRNA lysidine(34) synthetase TilS [Chitinophagaceae bacterium]|nr:tRNA lysidine(34) synthetase TilS [Chitinophagaceae bacterium]
MNLLQRYKENINDSNLFSEKDKLLLAVSGGVDSVVLCELCKQAGYDFMIAHCNFQLRGKESERDKKFVQELATKYDVEFLVKDFETEKYAEDNKLSIQEAARKLRYDWFKEILTSHHPRLSTTLTAHHADDNIETLLMNFFRGTGLYGLSGIPAKSPYTNVRRPLLPFWKEELLEFAEQNKLLFVEDSSNLSNKYTRNLFRNEIIPHIVKVYSQAKQNLQDNIERFTDIRKLYTFSVAELKKKLCRKKDTEIHIPIKQLMAYGNKALIFEIISDFGFTEKQVEEVIKLSESESGKFVQSPNAPFRIIKFRNWFVISAMASSHSHTMIVDEWIKNLPFPIGALQFEKVEASSFKLTSDNSIASLDADEIQFPLILRKWKQGDYFYPLGMKKKKKLSRFFIDQKLSQTGKENAWVLEMNKKIIWIVGMRIDDRFKITGNTKSVMRISFSAA